MKVSIVIPTLNAGPLFKEVLEAVKAQEFAGEFELVIVDSMSEDGTAELGKKYAQVFFQVRSEDFNHGETRNLAISRSSGDLIALLVQDAMPADRQWLKKLAGNFQDPKVAGAYSRQIARPDCNPLIRLRLQGWGAAQAQRRIQEMESSKVERFQGLKVEADHQVRALKPEQIREVIETFSFDNVSSMVRRSAWEEVKFPGRRFAEDIGWCQEVLSRGYKVVYEPESAVIHSHNKSLWYEFKRVYLDHQNWWQVGKFRIFNRRREVMGASLGGSVRAIRGLWREGLRDCEERGKRKEEGRPGGSPVRATRRVGPKSVAAMVFSLIGWSCYAPFFVFSQNLAQYLGGWADRWKEKYPWYAKIDRWISKGV